MWGISDWKNWLIGYYAGEGNVGTVVGLIMVWTGCDGELASSRIDAALMSQRPVPVLPKSSCDWCL